MFNMKKKTVREVLASFDKMIDDLDDIINDSQKDIEKSLQEIEVLKSKIEASTREKAAAQSSRFKLMEIVREDHQGSESELSAVAHPWDKVELA